MMMEKVVGTAITSWSVETGEGDLALIRYTQYIDEDAPTPDAGALDARLVEMVRGWARRSRRADRARSARPARRG